MKYQIIELKNKVNILEYLRKINYNFFSKGNSNKTEKELKEKIIKLNDENFLIKTANEQHDRIYKELKNVISCLISKIQNIKNINENNANNMNAKFISIDSKIYNCLIPCTKEDIFSEAYWFDNLKNKNNW